MWSVLVKLRRIINRPISYRSPGRCIYCGAEGELHDEHIIPSSIHGRLRFKKASCPWCEQITHAFEGRVIAGFYGDARVFLGLKRGNKRKWPEKFPVYIDRSSTWKNLTVTRVGDGRQFERIEVSISEHPGAIVCPVFSPAGIFSGTDDRSFKVAIAHAEGFHERLAKLGGGVVIGGPRPGLDDVARFYAKIAHSYAVARFGVGSFIPFLTAGIRGEGDLRGLWHFVGGQLSILPIEETGDVQHVLTAFQWTASSGHKVLLVRVHLFAADKLPAYDIAVGLATSATPLPP